MYSVILTQYGGAILGPVAKILGYLMNAIFIALDKIGIPNIGLAIILFTIVIYLILMPLTIRQQKFSKLSAKMNPEIQAIQEKYKGKKDNESMMRMNEETKAVYAKYGTSPTGSCVQLVIQMPILFALYRVIDNIPAYVTKVKEGFIPFVNQFIEIEGSKEFIQNKENFAAVARFSKQFANDLFINGDKDYVRNTFIDVLNKATTSEWHNIYAQSQFAGLKDLITNASHNGALDIFEKYNNFLGLNIANSPSYYFKEGISGHHYLLVLGALLIPGLSALTQWLNTKLMPQPENSGGNSQQDTMAASMKSMNIMMPIMSMFFCFSLPVGMGIYWIAGAVVRSIQQVVINKHLDKMNMDEIIEKNAEKAKVKTDKMKQIREASGLSSNARLSTKAIVNNDDIDKKEDVNTVSNENNNGHKPGSIAARANMVKNYNENK
ncbi:MAG: YidC/Oxa1 family membrane protein insertase [Lachnospiraceae bacterium]|nr:YidC/Oxa1 family membrane protein insertase [Lachnospiraceae bacterium]